MLDIPKTCPRIHHNYAPRAYVFVLDMLPAAFACDVQCILKTESLTFHMTCATVRWWLMQPGRNQ